MPQLVIGLLMVIVGVMAATQSLWVVRRAIRVWPHRIGPRDTDRFLSAEFLVRYSGLMVAAAGIGLVLMAIL